MTNNKLFDVIVIGGSYAGLSAAMALGRSLRKTLIIDSGSPCNRQTPHSNNFITQDGEKPAVISKKAKAQVLNYSTVMFLVDVALGGKKTKGGFEIITQSGAAFNAKKLIFATGIKDTIPNIEVFSECWGISIIHCPYCHGFEFKSAKTAIMANGERAFHIASLVNNLTDKITLLTSSKADFNAEQIAKLHKHKIDIIESSVSEIQHNNGHVKNIVFNDGKKIDFEAVYAAVPFTQHSDIPVALGCDLTEQGHIKIDMFQKTTIEGAFACGDNSIMMRSLSYAVAAGNVAGAMVNAQLTEESF